MKKNYGFDPSPIGTHTILLSKIPEKTSVLEVGTAGGYLGEYLILEKGCKVTGVEPVGDLYDDATKCGYEKLFALTAEDYLKTADPSIKFDRILLGDVLEHMVDPETVLKQLKDLIKPDGRIVISLPNVAHYTIRRHLMIGRWNTQNAGILDRTHLHFYTMKTASKMIESCGLKIEELVPVAKNTEWWMKGAWYPIGQKVLRKFAPLLAYQFVFVVKK